MLRAAAGVPPDLMAFFTQLVGKLQIVESCLWAVPVISVAIRSLGIVSQGVVHLGGREERDIRIAFLEHLVDACHDGIVVAAAFIEAVGVGVFRQAMLAQFRDVWIQTALELFEKRVRVVVL